MRVSAIGRPGHTDVECLEDTGSSNFTLYEGDLLTLGINPGNYGFWLNPILRPHSPSGAPHVAGQGGNFMPQPCVQCGAGNEFLALPRPKRTLWQLRGNGSFVDEGKKLASQCA